MHMRKHHYLICLFLLLPSHLSASDSTTTVLWFGATFVAATIGIPLFDRYIEKERAKLGDDDFSHEFLKRLQPAHAHTMQPFLAQYTNAQLDRRIIRPKRYRDMRLQAPILHWLGKHEDTEAGLKTFTHLIDRGCDITIRNTAPNHDSLLRHDSLLHTLCRTHHTHARDEMLMHVLQKKAAVNATNDNGETPLMVCSKNSAGSFAIACTLVAEGANLDVADIDDMTALTHALSMDRSEARGLYPLFFIAGARKLHPADYSDNMMHGIGHLQCLRASYPELVQVVANLPRPILDPEQQKRYHLLSTAEYAHIMENRLANLTDPEERLDCAVRLRYLQEPVQPWRAITDVAPIATAIDAHITPIDVADIILEYALIPGPIMEKKPSTAALLRARSNDEWEKDYLSDPDTPDAHENKEQTTEQLLIHAE